LNNFNMSRRPEFCNSPAREYGVKPSTLVFLNASRTEKERVTGILTAAGLQKTGRRVNEPR